MATMITAWEVKRFSPAGRDYPEVNICEAIPHIEEAFGYACLGEELYEYLLSVLSAYPESAPEYDEDEEYDTDDVVVRHGCLYKSNIDCNRTDPVARDSEWSAVDRFTTECANELWTKYLRRILAFKVHQAVMVYDTQNSGAGGVTINLGEGYNQGSRAANDTELARRQKRLEDDVNQTIENMYRWMNKKIEAGECTALPLQSATACWSAMCKSPQRGIRRWAFRV